MDSRLTLNVDENFLQMLESSFRQKEKIYLLLDENGIVRAEGLITAIDKNSSAASIELEGKKKIEVKTIVAVNGVFRPEYGEC
jgi:predicted metalloprotease